VRQWVRLRRTAAALLVAGGVGVAVVVVAVLGLIVALGIIVFCNRE